MFSLRSSARCPFTTDAGAGPTEPLAGGSRFKLRLEPTRRRRARASSGANPRRRSRTSPSWSARRGDSPRSARGGVRARWRRSAIERIRKRRRKKRRRARRRRRHVRVRAVRPVGRGLVRGVPAETSQGPPQLRGVPGGDGGVGAYAADVSAAAWRYPGAPSGCAFGSACGAPDTLITPHCGPATRVCGARWAWTCVRARANTSPQRLKGSYGGSFAGQSASRRADGDENLDGNPRPRGRSSADARGHVRFSIRSCLVYVRVSTRDVPRVCGVSRPAFVARAAERSRALSFASRTRRSAAGALAAALGGRGCSRARVRLRVANATTAWSEGSCVFFVRSFVHNKFRRGTSAEEDAAGYEPGAPRGTASCYRGPVAPAAERRRPGSHAPCPPGMGATAGRTRRDGGQERIWRSLLQGRWLTEDASRVPVRTFYGDYRRPTGAKAHPSSAGAPPRRPSRQPTRPRRPASQQPDARLDAPRAARASPPPRPIRRPQTPSRFFLFPSRRFAQTPRPTRLSRRRLPRRRSRSTPAARTCTVSVSSLSS